MKLTPFHKLTGDFDANSVFRIRVWQDKTWDAGVGHGVYMRMETYEALRKELNRLRKAVPKEAPHGH